MNTNSLLPKQWTTKQALILMVLCLWSESPAAG